MGQLLSEQSHPPRSNGSSLVLSILGIILGAILLLPGLCAGFMMVALLRPTQGGLGYEWFAIWVPCFAISAGGVVLILRAVRRIRSSRAGGLGSR